MRDSLDLERLYQQVRAQNRRENRHRLIFLVVVIAVILFGFALLPRINMTNAGALYFLNVSDNLWLPNAPAPDTPIDLDVAENGDIWVILRAQDGILRFNRNVATVFRRDDIGAPSADVIAFVLAGDDFWGVTSTAAIHYDGLGWRAYPEAVGDHPPTSIAITPNAVHITDAGGNLARYAGGIWTRTALDQLLPTTPDPDNNPQLLANGNLLWLKYGGLWRDDTEAWEEVIINGKDFDANTQLLAAENAGIWLSQGDGIFQVDSDGQTLAEYRLTDWDLPSGARITSFAPRDQRLWLATTAGDRVIDRMSGQATPIQTASDADPDAHTTRIRFEANGIPIATRVNSAQLANVVDEVDILLLLFGLAFTAVCAYALTIHMNRMPIFMAAREQLFNALPHLERRDSIYMSARIIIEYYVVFMLIFVANLALRNDNISPTIQQLIVIGIGAIIVSIVISWILRLRRHYRALDAAEQAALHSRYTLIVGGVLLYSVALYIVIDVVFRSAENTLVVIGAFILIALATDFALGSGQRLIRRLVYRRIMTAAVNDGNYEEALRLVGIWRKRFPHSTLLRQVHASVLDYMGRYDEEDAICWDILLRSQNSSPMAMARALADYGRTRALNGDLDTGMRSLETAVQIAPDFWQTYSRMADFYISTGESPDRAVLFAQKALDYAPDSAGQNDRRALLRGDLAASLALNGDWEMAETHIAAAQAAISPRFRPGQARLALIAGTIAHLRGDISVAAAHFKQAIEQDPKGVSGLMAQQALQQLMV